MILAIKSFMKKLMLFLLLINNAIILNAQRSDIKILKIDRKYETSFISDEIQVQSNKNNPFIAFSIALKGESINKNIDAIYYKDMQNEWQLFTTDENNYEHDAWYAMSYLDKGITKTQIKIIFKKPVQLDDVTFNFYFPKDTEYLSKQSQKEDSSVTNVKKTEDCGCSRPETIARNVWCPNNACPPNQNPVATDVKFLIVHHTAGSNTSNDWAAVVRSIWNNHVNMRGWSDIGYNFLLDRNGNIYDARADDTRGAHFSGQNSGTSGMALMGTFSTVVPSTVMLLSLENLLVWKSCDKSIDPLAIAFHASSGLNLHTIAGHRDGGNTECPGDELYDLLPAVRNNVNAQLNSCVLGVNDAILNGFAVYPNPFTEKITIDASQVDAAKLKIQCYDVVGRLVFDKTEVLTNDSLSLNLDFLSSGTYLLKVQGREKVSHIRLIKE